MDRALETGFDVAQQMQFSVTLLYSEIGIICAVILLYLFIKIKTSVILIPNKLYIYYMIMSLYAMIITDNLWKWIEDGFLHISIPLAYIINSTYFVTLDIFIYFVIFYFRDSKIRHTNEDIKLNTSRIKFESKIFIGAIFIVHIFINMSAFINHWFFYISEDCRYHYGKYYFFEYAIPYSILAICVVELLVKTYFEYLHGIESSIYEKPGNIVLYQFISVILGLVGFKVIDLPLFTVGITLFLVAFYVRMVEHFVRIDPVTKLHTRRSMMKIFNDRCTAHLVEFEPFTTCMFVINNYYDLNELDGVPIFNSIVSIIYDTFTKVNKEFSKYKPEVSRLDTLRFFLIISTDDKKVLDAYRKSVLENFVAIKKEIGEIEISVTYAYLRYNDTMKKDIMFNTLEERIQNYKENGINTYIL